VIASGLGPAELRREPKETKVFLLLFRKTKEDSSFFEKKEAKKLLFLRRSPLIASTPPNHASPAGTRQVCASSRT
jgi:hypothetical protein